MLTCKLQAKLNLNLDNFTSGGRRGRRKKILSQKTTQKNSWTELMFSFFFI
jgi:hypothetical protein